MAIPLTDDIAHGRRVSAADALGLARTQRLIGSILVRAGKLNASDIDMVLREADQTNVRFGEAALKLRLITPDDLRLGLANQYAFPALNVTDPTLAQRLPVAANPEGAFAESLRAVRGRIADDWGSDAGMCGSIAVTSVDRHDGRSFLAANLAVAFSQAGVRTLIIDADLRHPKQHTLFNVKEKLGLAGILSGRADVDEITHIAGLDKLALLQSGPPAPNPQELLSRPQFVELLGDLELKFDVVIIDTPAAADFSEAQLVARRAGRALVVARGGSTRQDSFGKFASYLQHAGVKVAAMVNRF